MLAYGALPHQPNFATAHDDAHAVINYSALISIPPVSEVTSTTLVTSPDLVGHVAPLVPVDHVDSAPLDLGRPCVKLVDIHAKRSSRRDAWTAIT